MNPDGRSDSAGVSMDIPTEADSLARCAPGAGERAQVYEAARQFSTELKTVVALVDGIARNPKKTLFRQPWIFGILAVLAMVYLAGSWARIFPAPSEAISMDLLAACVAGPFLAVLSANDARRKREAELSAARGEVSGWVRAAWQQKPNRLPIEAELAAVAAGTASEIECHRAWRSDWLDTQRIRFDPAEGARQTVAGLGRLHEVRQSLGPAPSPEAFQGRPRQVHDRQLAELHTVQDGLADRIAATRIYLVKLDELGVLLDALESMNRSVSADAQIAELVGRSVQDQLPTDALIGLAGELDFVTQGLRAAIAFLDGPGQLPQNGTAGTSSQLAE